MEISLIQNKIHEIRGLRIMLDFDLAELYQIENKRLKESVRRNIKRFPPDFMFVLSKEEYDSLRSQFAALKTGRGQHSKYTPFAFTEHGVAMLAAVLNSDKAIDMNINIIRAFIALKQLVLEQKDLMEQLKEWRTELHQRIDVHDAQLSQIYEAIENMLDDQVEKKEKEEAWKHRNRIGFKNEKK
ncbi:ORF6N domain-containing protein [Niabella yanshanensis]|uniref:ORF6N domain-containing protein n=1 Tax=Niabella yanshanensis TaxID=577386 RepID=A0ABZ0W1E0_9BACT|nr:ORF6N domain-containing protein [Niabella yanshanensis]WQD36729.1 ORF6N domain-containing protein [Niabella yanshanensis]